MKRKTGPSQVAQKDSGHGLNSAPAYKQNLARRAQGVAEKLLSLSTLEQFAIWVSKKANPFKNIPTVVDIKAQKLSVANQKTKPKSDTPLAVSDAEAFEKSTHVSAEGNRQVARITADDISITAMQLYMRNASVAFGASLEDSTRSRQQSRRGGTGRFANWLGSSLDLIDGMIARKNKARSNPRYALASYPDFNKGGPVATEQSHKKWSFTVLSPELQPSFNLGASVDALADRLAEIFVAEKLSETDFIREKERQDLIVAVTLSTLTKAMAEVLEVKVAEQSEAGMIARRRAFYRILNNVRGALVAKEYKRPRYVKEMFKIVRGLIGDSRSVAQSRLMAIKTSGDSIQAVEAKLECLTWENLSQSQKTELVKMYVIISRVKKLTQVDKDRAKTDEELTKVDLINVLKKLQNNKGAFPFSVNIAEKLLAIIPEGIRESLDNEPRLNRVEEWYVAEIDPKYAILLMLIRATSDTPEQAIQNLSAEYPPSLPELMRQLKLNLTLTGETKFSGLTDVEREWLQGILDTPEGELVIKELDRLYDQTEMTPYHGQLRHVLDSLLRK